MRKELADTLIAKYPKILTVDIGVNDGWYNIIDDLCTTIQNYIDNSWTYDEQGNKKQPKQVTATQIKQKFGGLIFYVRDADNYVYGMLAYAEHLSYKTCEVCGSPGEQKKSGGFGVRCEQHINSFRNWIPEKEEYEWVHETN